ncbi:MAG: DNA-binding protein [Pedobacter sp.]|nr:MAG: DNA-binding protein [Pedobacter sp.]
MNTKYRTLQRSFSPEINATVSNKITQQDKLLTSFEVSQMIGKSEAWLARKRWEGGGIPYRKIGRNVRYQTSIVLDWLNNQPIMSSTSGVL